MEELALIALSTQELRISIKCVLLIHACLMKLSPRQELVLDVQETLNHPPIKENVIEPSQIVDQEKDSQKMKLNVLNALSIPELNSIMKHVVLITVISIKLYQNTVLAQHAHLEQNQTLTKETAIWLLIAVQEKERVETHVWNVMNIQEPRMTIVSVLLMHAPRIKLHKKMEDVILVHHLHTFPKTKDNASP